MLMREFWSGEIARFHQSHTFKNVEAHGVRLFALRPLRPLTYLGSDLHLAQGIELKHWQLTDSSLEIGLDLGRKTEGNIYLWSEKNHVLLNKTRKHPLAVGEQCSHPESLAR